MLTAQKHTHSSPNVYRVESVSHVNTVAYGLSKCKQVSENLSVCQYYMHTFRLNGTAFLIICVINVNRQKMLNVYLLSKLTVSEK